MREHVETKLVSTWAAYSEAARQHEREGRTDAAWACLEAAHILGQRLTGLHTITHVRMLGLAWRTRDLRELAGQTLRLFASVLVTWAWVPIGNSGRSNVSALAPAPVPRDLQELL